MRAAGNEVTRRRFLAQAAAATGAVGAYGLLGRPAQAAARSEQPMAELTTGVAVLGGGVGGLTVAHELAERGFEVAVFEPKALGGKARSIPVAGSASGGRADLPGEHGFRFFPGFYKNVPDTMRRIPVAGNPNGVFDHLVDASQELFVFDAGQMWLLPSFDQAGVSEGMRSLITSIGLAAKIPPNEIEYFIRKMEVFQTSGDARRNGQWENVAWWDYVNAEHFSPEYQRVFGTGLTKDLVAAKGTKASTRTIGLMALAFVYASMAEASPQMREQSGYGAADRLLDAPTNEAWINPWVAHLQRFGVRFVTGYRATKLWVTGDRITGASLLDGNGHRLRVAADHYVAAMPVERARVLFDDGVRGADPALARLDALQSDYMNGIQFFLERTPPPGQRSRRVSREPLGPDLYRPGPVLEGRPGRHLRERTAEGHPVGGHLGPLHRRDPVRQAGCGLYRGADRSRVLGPAQAGPQLLRRHRAQRRHGDRLVPGPGNHLRGGPPSSKYRAAAHQHHRFSGQPSGLGDGHRELVPGCRLRPLQRRPGHHGGRQRGRPSGRQRHPRPLGLARRQGDARDAVGAARVRQRQGCRRAALPCWPSQCSRHAAVGGPGMIKPDELIRRALPGRQDMMTAKPRDGALLRRYAGDWRSILEGTSIGLLQLMYPPLGAAVAAQSGLFEDPYGRIYRSIPQIWATILAPDANERARRIRDLHRGIRGVVNGQKYHALEPETFWWAHATFTHLIIRSVERYHWRNRLDDRGYEHLYADTVAWYERYNVSLRAVPASYTEFRTTFERFCAERLERTPAVQRLVARGDDARPRARPASTPLELLTAPILSRWGRLSTIGNLPPIVREHLGLPWSQGDQMHLDRLAQAYRLAFDTMPSWLNRSTFEHALRRTGSRTRLQRFVPPERAA